MINQKQCPMKKCNLFGIFILFFALSGCVKNEGPPTPDNDPPKQSLLMRSLEDAKAEVEFLVEQIDGKTRADGAVRKIADCYCLSNNFTTRSKAETVDDELITYVLNFENNEGYAIVAGDKRIACPVLALTDSGSINPEKGIDNPGLISFLAMAEYYCTKEVEKYEAEMNAKVETRIDVGYTDWVWDGEWQVKELLGKRTYLNWNQRSPFNNNISLINGQRPPLGCTATATMLLMAWYQYPQVYNGHRYNWTEMLKHRNERTNQNKVNPAAYSDLALLSEIITRPENLDMKFALDGSGAWLYNVPRTLQRLGYFHGGTHGAWSISTVLNELKEYPYYPVLVSAYAYKTVTRSEVEDNQKILGINIHAPEGTKYTEGHTFMLESAMIRERKIRYVHPGVSGPNTKTETLVYVNYGWSGTDNGYYNAGVFDTVSGPVVRSQTGNAGYYQYNITMLYGVRI